MKLQYEIKITTSAFNEKEKMMFKEVCQSLGKEQALKQLENQLKEYCSDFIEEEDFIEVKAEIIEEESE